MESDESCVDFSASFVFLVPLWLLPESSEVLVYDKQRLIELVRKKALKFGEFTLASGKKASFYLDGKQITLDAQGAVLIAEGILDLLGPRLPKAVGGMAIGADPI